MAIPRVRSRAQFQGRNKLASQRNKRHVEPQKRQQTNNIPPSPEEAPKVYTFSVGSDDPIYQDCVEPLEPEDAFFLKQRVSTKEEKEMSGAFKSQFPPAEVMSNGSSRPDSPVSLVNCPSPMATNSDPSDSLLVQASLFVPNLEEYEWATRNQPEPVVEETKTDHPSKSWQDWIVDLFAGRTASSSSRSSRSNKSSNSSAASSLVIVEPVTPPPDIIVSEHEDPTHHTLPVHPLKRIPLPQVIPTIRAATFENPCPRTNYRNIPPASMHPYTGYAAVAQDAFTPGIISRGFAAPHRNPLPPRRNNTENSLLDRKGDAWLLWSQRIRAPDDLPFARPQPQEQICVQALVYPGSVARRGVCRHDRKVRLLNTEWPWVC